MKAAGEEKTIGQDVTVEEVMKTVEQDRPYYYRSGGGLLCLAGKACASRRLHGTCSGLPKRRASILQWKAWAVQSMG